MYPLQQILYNNTSYAHYLTIVLARHPNLAIRVVALRQFLRHNSSNVLHILNEFVDTPFSVKLHEQCRYEQ